MKWGVVGGRNKKEGVKKRREKENERKVESIYYVCYVYITKIYVYVCSFVLFLSSISITQSLNHSLTRSSSFLFVFSCFLFVFFSFFLFFVFLDFF